MSAESARTLQYAQLLCRFSKKANGGVLMIHFKGITGAARLILGLVAVAAFAAPAMAAKKPNIVVIFGDDIGQDNISAYHRGLLGNRTPNIDRIAAQGAIELLSRVVFACLNQAAI
jgi:hypothetical protein